MRNRAKKRSKISSNLNNSQRVRRRKKNFYSDCRARRPLSSGFYFKSIASTVWPLEDNVTLGHVLFSSKLNISATVRQREKNLKSDCRARRALSSGFYFKSMASTVWPLEGIAT